MQSEARSKVADEAVVIIDAILKAKELAVSGLMTDGEHHKQWYLEEILKALGFDIGAIRQELLKEDYDWEPGIAP